MQILSLGVGLWQLGPSFCFLGFGLWYSGFVFVYYLSLGFWFLAKYLLSLAFGSPSDARCHLALFVGLWALLFGIWALVLVLIHLSLALILGL